MTEDHIERITSIEWSPYGKVKAVRKDQTNNTNSCTSTEYEDADVEFLYTAGQQRLCKIVKPHKASGAGIEDQDNWIYYWYVYDAGGNLMGVYKQTFTDNGSNSWTVKVDLEENGVYGSGRNGIRHADDESDYYQTFTSTMSSGEFATTFSYTASSGAYNKTHYTRTIGYKQYEVANHLGNVLATISDKRLLYATGVSPTEVDWYVADVQSYTDYYVFGAPQTGRAGGSYRYGFNGMEQDAEVKNGEHLSYTTEFRQYDPRVGRWLSPDPIVKPWESPYAAFANNPVVFVDPSGLTPSTGGGDPPKEEPKQQKTGFFKRLLNFLRNDQNPQTNCYTDLPDPGDFKEGSIVYIIPGGTGPGNVKNTGDAAVPFILFDGQWSSSHDEVVIVGLTGGTYHVEVPDANGCMTRGMIDLGGGNMVPYVSPEEQERARALAEEQARFREELEWDLYRMQKNSDAMNGLNPDPFWDPNITQEEGARNAINCGILVGSMTLTPFLSPGAIAASEGNALLRAGNAADRGGYTAAGRALMKHGSRPGSPYPKATGNVAAVNSQGTAVLESIVTNPNAVSCVRHHVRFGNILEVKIPGGMGARFTADGKTFIGFLE